jgi:hypothetical protein
MKEYSISIKEDGSGILTKNAWNTGNDEEIIQGQKVHQDWLYKPGMIVVTKNLEIITINDIRKSLSKNGYSSPKWRIISDKKEYWASEIAGIFVREIEPYEIESFVKGL